MAKQVLALVSSLLLAATCGSATAATCRAGSAAAQGAQHGYERDMGVAAEETKKNMERTDMLQQCVGGISSLGVTNAFPSLGDQINQQINKICYAVRSKIYSIGSVGMGKINDVTGGMAQVSPVSTGGGAPSSSDIWKTLWR